MAHDDGLPAFCRMTAADRKAAWALYHEGAYGPTGHKPKLSLTSASAHNGPTGPQQGEPSYVSHKLGYPLSESEILGLRDYRRANQERKERTTAIAEERKLKADDESIVQAVREHEHKKKRGKRGRKVKTIRDV